MNTANWDLQDHAAKQSLVLDMGADRRGAGRAEAWWKAATIPYLPAALAKKKENFENRHEDGSGGRSAICRACRAPPTCRIRSRFSRAQKAIAIAYEYDGAFRNIYLKDPGPAPVDTWMGQSVGHWEGDTLVVDVTGLNERTWFDRAGDYHSDALHVVERYTLRSPEVLWYEATIEDPKVYSAPWKISMPLYRHVEKNAQLLEFKCVEFVEDLMYGQFSKKPKE